MSFAQILHALKCNFQYMEIVAKTSTSVCAFPVDQLSSSYQITDENIQNEIAKFKKLVQQDKENAIRISRKTASAPSPANFIDSAQKIIVSLQPNKTDVSPSPRHIDASPPRRPDASQLRSPDKMSSRREDHSPPRRRFESSNGRRDDLRRVHVFSGERRRSNTPPRYRRGPMEENYRGDQYDFARRNSHRDEYDRGGRAYRFDRSRSPFRPTSGRH
jgi:hypothetical protein